MSGADCFNDIPTEIFAANLTETNGDIYEHLPNNNVCPVKNFVTDVQQQNQGATSTGGGSHEESTDCNNGSSIKKVSKSRSKSGMGRGRPRKALVAMYHSQISGDKNTIKIRIKKSNFTAQVQLSSAPNKKKSGRRKKQKVTSDTDVSDYEYTAKKSKNESDVTSTQDQEPQEQSVWGEHVPENVLYKIFQNVCFQDGCLPNLVRLCRVCKLWRNVALTPSLWNKVDLNYVKEPFRTDLQLHWLIYNRLSCCQDLNLGEWKVRDIQIAIEALCTNCPELQGINLSGWKGLNADNLKYLTTECKKLERLDLSSINSTSAINSQPLVAMGQTMSSRLTHLVLAHNKMAGFTQIMASIAANCPNLQLLDISNIRTFAHNSALLHVEKLQIGCPKLRVLRITNSQIWLAPASLTDQVASPGFPLLEELSLAGLEEDQTTTSRSVDDDGIERILKNSTKLRLLDVRGCIRLTDSGLVKVPAWDLEHLFLSACYITRTQNSGLELIVQKWSHSLLEVDLAWSTATESLDAAVMALAEKGSESKLRIVNLCGSSVSLEPVKAVLNCPNLHSINLQSCRALPRGIKRLYTGDAVQELKQSLQNRPKNDVSESETEQSPAHPIATAVE
ncbi:F-box/LRR-repeat protein 6 isoform X2 [Tribolium castaneum]|uniref:F-box/LRR-repeat protein 6-like Protein n=1 Tax=Tribolium castaneum TaxID=7070 RepID=D6X564_TRICA|nr:PREDICTED: F-box/LRR-repeat protein 6 isoform X2 [Tribolium castaneum]EEZ97209.2 F-box/LRR-repeat protein 6-like Protein [Tribolium castaneum]|eukprot:XP_008200342.1 PREDICTED: F-box/LRR-repeat protein 6 isoform X2 [Tribolium castaneum]